MICVKLFFIFQLFLFFSHSLFAWNGKTDNLIMIDFSIYADSSKNPDIWFPNGLIGSMYEKMGQTKATVTHNMQAEASLQVIDQENVRFHLTEPINLEIADGEKRTSVSLGSFDLRVHSNEVIELVTLAQKGKNHLFINEVNSSITSKEFLNKSEQSETLTSFSISRQWFDRPRAYLLKDISFSISYSNLFNSDKDKITLTSFRRNFREVVDAKKEVSLTLFLDDAVTSLSYTNGETPILDNLYDITDQQTLNFLQTVKRARTIRDNYEWDNGVPKIIKDDDDGMMKLIVKKKDKRGAIPFRPAPIKPAAIGTNKGSCSDVVSDKD